MKAHSKVLLVSGASRGLGRAITEAALEAGLGIIVCVGETLEERDAGRAEDVVRGQVAASIPAADRAGAAQPGKIAVAYEPVWAIGTGRVAAVDDVIAMHRTIRETLVAAYGEAGSKVRILYGGSVNAGNAADLLSSEGVGGALVGGASLTAEAFLPIVAAAGSEED